MKKINRIHNIILAAAAALVIGTSTSPAHAWDSAMKGNPKALYSLETAFNGEVKNEIVTGYKGSTWRYTDNLPQGNPDKKVDMVAETGNSDIPLRGFYMGDCPVDADFSSSIEIGLELICRGIEANSTDKSYSITQGTPSKGYDECIQITGKNSYTIQRGKDSVMLEGLIKDPETGEHTIFLYTGKAGEGNNGDRLWDAATIVSLEYSNRQLEASMPKLESTVETMQKAQDILGY